MNEIRVIVSGGGTGGHIFPAVAIANEIRNRMGNQAKILFVGAKGRMEMKRIPEAGYDIIGLDIAGLQRQLTLKNIIKNLAFPFKVIKSTLKARSIIKNFKPDIVIGVGGYASGPTLKAACRMNIPTLIQESNSYPGLTNRMLGKEVNAICTAYDGMEKYFPKEKIKVLGNPVRDAILNFQDKADEAYRFFELDKNKKVVLVIGGSLGARSINQAIYDAIEVINQENIQLIWQTGERFYQEYEKEVNAKQLDNIHIMPFINRMDYAYAVADIVVLRAGALSIAELCEVGKPGILLPSPNVAEDHQTKNAQALVNKNAAVYIADADAQRLLKEAILSLIKDEERCKTIAMNAKKLAKRDAVQQIVNVALSLIPQSINQ